MTVNPHRSATIAALLSGLVGVASTLAGLTGSAPAHTSGTATVSGAVLVAVSVVGWLAHHFGLSKEEVAAGRQFVVAHLGQIEEAAAAAGRVPAVEAAVHAVEHAGGELAARLDRVESAAAKVAPAPALDVAKLAADVKALIVTDAVGSTPPVAAPAAEPVAPATAA